MKVSDYIVRFFEEKGIEYIFGYQGGMITHLVDSISKSSRVKFIQTYHEQSAAFAAEGYAQESGKIGVAISTSGPGATNMITGIANAYLDSIPVIYITGQVNTYDYKYEKNIRQQGFQELDIVTLTKSITKYSKLIDTKEEIISELEKAYKIATSGRKGPVVLDIPMNIQREEIEETFIIKKENKRNEKRSLTNILEEIYQAQKPLILLGAGAKSLESRNYISKLVRLTNIPIVTSLMGKGNFNELDENYLGMVGSYGNRCANIAMGECDCLIAIGTRLDNRQTGNMIKEFTENKIIIHVDIDKEELENNRLNNRIKLNMRSEDFLEELLKEWQEYKVPLDWYNYTQYLKKEYSQDNDIEKNIENKLPYQFIQSLNNYTKFGDIVTVDIGQNQMWTAQTLKLKENQKWMTSGGLAPMGYSLPTAVGAAFASKSKEKNIFSIMGDGGFQIAIQSLPLVVQYDLPIKVIVLNNEALGLITQFQELYFNSNMIGTTKRGGYLVPNLIEIANAYNIEYAQITKENIENRDYVENILKKRNILIEVKIEGLTKVYPKLEYNARIEDMIPKIIKENLYEW